jgi:MFS family permease
MGLFHGDVSATVLKYYLYKSTTAIEFTAPIWQICLLDRGISFTQLFVLDAVYAATITLGEPPTGYIGDRIGRRHSILISTALLATSIAAFGFMHSFWPFVGLYIVWALGATFKSGSVAAWLYDTLDETGETDDFARIRGRGNAIQSAGSALSVLGAGYLATIDYRIPFVATGLITALGIPVVLRLPKTSPQGDDTDGQEALFDFEVAHTTVRETLFGTTLRSLVAYMTLSAVIFACLNTLIQPTTLRIGTRFGLSHEQVLTGLGWLYAGFTAATAVASYFVGTIKDHVGLATAVHAVPLFVGLMFAGVTVAPVLAIPGFFLMKSLRTIVSPLQGQYINDYTPSLGRATVLSALSMVLSLSALPIYVIIGWLTDRFDPISVVAVLGIVLLIGSLVILCWKRPISAHRS